MPNSGDIDLIFKALMDVAATYEDPNDKLRKVNKDIDREELLMEAALSYLIDNNTGPPHRAWDAHWRASDRRSELFDEREMVEMLVRDLLGYQRRREYDQESEDRGFGTPDDYHRFLHLDRGLYGPGSQLESPAIDKRWKRKTGG